MSYYSDVAIVIDKTKLDEFMNYLCTKALELGVPTSELHIKLFEDCDSKRQGNSFVFYLFRSIQWRSFEPPFSLIEEALNYIGEEHYCFHRLGEEYGDYECFGEFSPPDVFIYPSLELVCDL